MAHVHTIETHHGPSATASVLADIGGDVGAAAVYTPDALLGSELEIRAAGHEWDGTHTAVRERQVDGSTLCAGFFATLAAGHYELRVRGSAGPTRSLQVRGGHVVEVRW